MKLYIANGTYVGTQADAKAITKQFTEADVPTDKAGLIAYLNSIVGGPNFPDDQFETVVARQDPPVAYDGDFDLDAAFKSAPMEQRLDLTADMLKEIEALLAKSMPATQVWEEKPDPRKDAEARKTFASWKDEPQGEDEDLFA